VAAARRRAKSSTSSGGDVLAVNHSGRRRKARKAGFEISNRDNATNDIRAAMAQLRNAAPLARAPRE